jgi:hypothetical protein
LARRFDGYWREGHDRLAESTLGIEETDIIGVALDQLLIGVDDRADGDLRPLVSLALEYSSSRDSVTLRAAADPDSRFIARTIPCWPPAAALLALTHPPAEEGGEPPGTGATSSSRSVGASMVLRSPTRWPLRSAGELGTVSEAADRSPRGVEPST